ncbi:uncharacterized protein LOC131155901 [Malania oleifera]|uniref:uncharacterized protein LOC131155901 n=1 Tax=Malania oleifera TaxID=397392 RepID=UPI0025AE9E5A|nr:uncharacterized protein LOC131155901 [Malania oleifera]
MVELSLYDLKVMGSRCGNSLLRKCMVRLYAIDPSSSAHSPDPIAQELARVSIILVNDSRSRQQQRVETSKALDGETKATSTLNSNGLDSSSLLLSMERLNGKNFCEWAQSIKLVIDGKGKLGYPTSEKKKPASTDATTLQKWKSKNSMVTAWLVNSMKPSIGKTYLFLSSAKDV